MSFAADTARGEDGSVLVMVALWLPVLLIFVSFALDVANWFEHQRHLQTQADAAALAGGQAFQFPCSDTTIEEYADTYGGGAPPYVPNYSVPWNPQVVGPAGSTVHELINSDDFFNNGGNTFSDPNGPPCRAGYVDVKMTESNLPFFFGILSLFGGPTTVPAINAHARVSILNEVSQGGALPIGVPDNNPTHAAAIVVNDDTGATVSAWALAQSPTPISVNGTSLTEWDNGGAPATVTIPTAGANLAVVVALSGGAIDLTSQNANTICNEPLVECFQATTSSTGGVTSTTGLTFIHGYPTTGSGSATAPIIRDAFMTVANCSPDPYFADAACAPTLYVKADFGGTQPAGAVATGAGCPNAGCPLTLDTTAGSPTLGYWYGPLVAPQGNGSNAAAGSYPINFSWCASTANCKANQVTGTAVKVQRMFVASSDPAVSGPVELVQVGEQSGATLANSIPAGAYSPTSGNGLVFHVGVVESLNANAQSAADPPVLMRLAGNGSNSSLNQSLDCDPNYPNLSDELHLGCQPQYEINQGLAPWSPCPSPSVFGMTQPWQCVNTQTGGAVGQVASGLAARFGDSGGCPNPSHWALFPNLPTGDPRIVQVFLVPFGSFSGAGTTSVPVEGFATFYVTGWYRDPCSTGPAYPAAPVDGKDDPVPNGSGAYVIGHFIKYVNNLGNGSGAGACDPNALNTCIAVLTQ